MAALRATTMASNGLEVVRLHRSISTFLIISNLLLLPLFDAPYSPPAAVPVQPVRPRGPPGCRPRRRAGGGRAGAGEGRSRDTWLCLAEPLCLAAVPGYAGVLGVRLTGIAGDRAPPAAHRLAGAAHHRAECLNRSRRSQRCVTGRQRLPWRPRRLQRQRRRVWRR